MLCQECFQVLYSRLSLPAKKILQSLQDNKSYNKNQIMINSNLAINATNNAIQELKGAGMIEIRSFGNNKLVKLTESSKLFLEVMK